ncbi:MAG: hypothetical protein HRT57_09985 [Crocinitomicaceae bacterium]|nr:hypothetical protein [Crocinitomicaceae bacterium]
MEQNQNHGAASGEQFFSANTEFNRFGLISMVPIIVGCTGGIAVGMGAVQSTLALILIVIPTMTTLSLLLAVSPMKYIMTSGIIATIVNLLFIAYYIIA